MPLLRPMKASDWRAVHEWARLPESSRYQGWGPNSEATTRDYCRRTARIWGKRGQTRFPYVIVVDDRVIGAADLHLRDETTGEIGYGVHPAAWGRGVATSAALELLRIGFADQGLHRIYATCDPRNAASARVLTKIGMTYEGRLRETMLLDDGWRDSSVYAILEDEFTPGPD